MTAFFLSDILIYPVKSLAGIHVTHWPVTNTGLQYDRKWMLIDETGHFLSQRSLPTMALIHTAIEGDTLILSAPNRDDLHLSLKPQEGRSIPCTIWQDHCVAKSVSQLADQWFSDFLNQDCRLVYHDDKALRLVDPRYATDTDQTAFSDGFPFLILSENSLASLNQAMSLELPMSRFRPNLVISGCPAYAEDSWREIQIGELDFRLPNPCSRCSVPAVDPDTAQVGKEPLSTLSRLRKWQNKVYFGQNALHNQKGSLAIGDAVKVTRRGVKQPPIESF